MLCVVLLCGVSAISAAHDSAIDNNLSEMDSGSDLVSVSNDEKAAGVDDDSALNAQENEIIGQSHITYSQNNCIDLDYTELIAENSENNKLMIDSNSNILDSSDNLIQNPNFDDGLDGWNVSDSTQVVIKNDAEHGNYVALSTPAKTPVSLSQYIDLTNIDSITYYISDNGASTKYCVNIDNDLGNLYTTGSITLKKGTGWTEHTINTQEYKGYANLSFLITIKGTYYIDSISYAIKNSADFYINTYINTPINFNYTTTENITKWYWNFGDGTYSNISNPTHCYPEIGTNEVILTISNVTDSKNITYSVDVIEKVIANFNLIRTSNNFIYLNDTSSGTPYSWFWDWGDGKNNTYVESLPTNVYHSYPNSFGKYDVTLTVTDKFGNTSSITKKEMVKYYNSVAYPINVDTFENSTNGWSNATLHYGPYLGHNNNTVNAGYYVTGEIEKVINFDDVDVISALVGGNDAAGYHPGEFYIDNVLVYRNDVVAQGFNAMGIISYDVSKLYGNHTLKITSGYRIDKVTFSKYIYLANFSIASSSVVDGNVSVTFKDASYGIISGYLWEFDDGTNSTSQNPTHTFTQGDHYAVLHIYHDGLEMDKYTYYFSLSLPTVNGTSYGTIQEAIDNASENDVIDITPLTGGEYSENFIFNKSLTLNFNGAVLSAKDVSAPLFNITNGATVTVTNLGLNKDSTLVTDSDSRLIIKDSDIGVDLALSEGNIDLLDDSFNNSVLTIVANTNIANSTISKGGVIVNGGKSKIFNTTLTGSDVAITQTAGELDIISNLITDNNIGVNVTGGKTNMEYNLIYANAKFGLVYVGDNVSMDNNWWGNNFPQYESGANLSDNYLDIFRKEADSEVDLSLWLELNVNTTTSIMGINKEYPVTIDLTKNSEPETINGYLKTITLDFVSDGGDVLNSATLENGIGQITLLTTNTDVKNVNITREGKNYALNTDIVSKTNVNIDVTGELVEGATANVVIEVPQATGNITIIIDGVSSTVALDNSQYALTMDNLTAGKHTLFVVYEGNDIFNSLYNSTSIDVTAKEIVTSTIKITSVDGNLTVTGILKDSKDSVIANEVISYQIGEGDIQNTTTNADGIFTLTGVNGATITVSYFGNDNVVGSSDSITLSDIASDDENNKAVSELENQLNEAQANATKLADNLTDANKKVEDLKAELGEVQANASKLNSDLVDANSKVENLTAELGEAQANVTKLNSDLADANSKVENLTAELGEAQANVTKLTNDLADANAKVDDLTSELNQANITKLTNDLAEATQKVSNLTTQLEEAQANATKLNSDLVDANSKVVNLTEELGEAQANATKLQGELEVANDKAGNLTAQLGEAQKQIQTLSAELISTTVAANNLNIKALTSGNVQVTLKANGTALANKTVNVIINGVTYNGTTDDNGVAKIAVKFASAGTYYATVTFAGDDTYKSSISTSKVVVSKKATKITAPKKTFKAKTKTKKVKITLKSGSTILKSKKITLKVNGKTYTAKTNSKGVATIKVTKLTKKGTFKYTVKFAGDKAYKAISKKGKIIIK
ncbi:PKD domain-containing protein [Methanobrevibacter sp.]|uniref:PKD domain-containing protein n=1 Tax=Methanobrevibacter sp. TaxID=66852 RepID=UPI0038683697